MDRTQPGQRFAVKRLEKSQPLAGGGVQVHRLQAKSAQLRAVQVMGEGIELYFELRIVDGYFLVGAADLVQFITHRLDRLLFAAAFGQFGFGQRPHQPLVDGGVLPSHPHCPDNPFDELRVSHGARIRMRSVSWVIKRKLCSEANRKYKLSFILNRRSEERRVGKECRSRWS